jgi:hypothetical protein
MTKAHRPAVHTLSNFRIPLRKVRQITEALTFQASFGAFPSFLTHILEDTLAKSLENPTRGQFSTNPRGPNRPRPD